MRDMSEIIAGLQQKQQKQQKQKALIDQPSNLVKLPAWSDTVRGVPNGVLRSALFGVIRRGKRAYLQAEQMASVNGVSVLFTGPRLDQADLDVWEQCLQISRTDSLGVRIEFSGHGFLKSIGRDTGKSQHEWLENALRRLMSSVVEIKDGKKVYAGQLIHHWARDDETRRHVIVINPAMAELYGDDGWSSIEWGQRLMLKGPLAQWLHGFYTTHAKPYPYKVSTLHQLCGSENAHLYDFRRELKQALDKIKDQTGWLWEIIDDLVYINKKPSPSQLRHLASKVKKAKKARHSTHEGTA